MKQSREYKTKQGTMIINYLENREEKHFTVEDLMDDFKKDGISIGKSTVYRQLDKLVNDGIVRKYYIEEGASACFQYINKDDNCKEHFHFKCIKCGRLFHVECDYLEAADEHIFKEHKFKVDNSKTVFYGKCDKCS